MRRRHVGWIGLMGVVVLSGSAGAVALNSGFRFLAVTPSVRSVGMGGAVPHVRNTSEVVSENPALAAKIPGVNISFNYLLLFADQNYLHTAALLGKSAKFGAFFGRMGSESFAVIRDFQETQDIAQDQNIMVGGVLAGTLPNSPLSLGVAVKYISSTVVDTKASAVFADAGALVEFGKPSLGLAVAVRNLGAAALVGEEEAVRPPTSVKATLSRDLGEFLTVAVSYSRELDSEVQQVSVGGELFPKAALRPRVGYALMGNLSGFNAGVGILLSPKAFKLRLDYAVNLNAERGAAHWLALGLFL